MIALFKNVRNLHEALIPRWLHTVAFPERTFHDDLSTQLSNSFYEHIDILNDVFVIGQLLSLLDDRQQVF